MATRARAAGVRPKRRASPGWGRLAIAAVGHSNRSLAELVELLRAHGIRTLADVRTVPRSRANPQFNRERLARALPARSIRYQHLAALGGLRHGLGKKSKNTAWRNASFRGYADYMQTPEFRQGLEQLRALARKGPTAVMCAESLRWRCHRSLIADALWARGVVVCHLESPRRAVPHRPTGFARFHGPQVTYPGSPDQSVRPRA